MNLLIIEDDTILAEKILKVFKLTWNFNNIKILNSYNAFLREYNVITSYDIILVDIILSKPWDKNNWIKIVNLIRQKSQTIPTIIISCLWEILWLEEAFNYWVNDYLIKPFRLKELEIRVNSWFRTFLYNNLIVKKELDYYWLKKTYFLESFIIMMKNYV